MAGDPLHPSLPLPFRSSFAAISPSGSPRPVHLLALVYLLTPLLLSELVPYPRQVQYLLQLLTTLAQESALALLLYFTLLYFPIVATLFPLLYTTTTTLLYSYNSTPTNLSTASQFCIDCRLRSSYDQRNNLSEYTTQLMCHGLICAFKILYCR